MKNKVVVLLLIVVMAFSFTMPSFAMSNDIDPQANMSSLRATYFDFYGASGTRYRVNFSSDTVGYNHITVGNKVKVCQAYTRIVSGSTIAVDGI